MPKHAWHATTRQLVIMHRISAAGSNVTNLPFLSFVNKDRSSDRAATLMGPLWHVHTASVWGTLSLHVRQGPQRFDFYLSTFIFEKFNSIAGLCHWSRHCWGIALCLCHDYTLLGYTFVWIQVKTSSCVLWYCKIVWFIFKVGMLYCGYVLCMPGAATSCASCAQP